LEKDERRASLLLLDIPDTEENSSQRIQCTHNIRIIQIKIKKLEDYLTTAKRMQYAQQDDVAQTEKEKPYYDATKYPDPIYHRQMREVKPFQEKNLPIQEEKRKIQPTGYISKADEKAHYRYMNRKQLVTQYQNKQKQKNAKDVPVEAKPPEWVNLPLSAEEYVKNYPMVISDDPKTTADLLYRKFNADGINDYRQIELNTGYDKQQEVIIITEITATESDWDTVQMTVQIPMTMAKEFLVRLQYASRCKLGPFSKDVSALKASLYSTTLEKSRTHLQIRILNDRGPQGNERMVYIIRRYATTSETEHITLPWMQLPRLVINLESLINEYEYTPGDIQNS